MVFPLPQFITWAGKSAAEFGIQGQLAKKN